MFLSEEKNQKTFAPFGFGLSGSARRKVAKVFCFFFSKKTCFPASLSDLRRGTAPRLLSHRAGEGAPGQLPVFKKKFLLNA
jgi:hypothetical protein